jgi:tetratricopeptide (TPR) repeat protein
VHWSQWLTDVFANMNKPPHTRCTSYWQQAVLAVALLLPATAMAQNCPSLQAYYPADPSQWPLVVDQLLPLLPLCLESADYFALLGAAQLNSGDLAAALEALERALLLDPASGAAQVDYAEALYLAGQLFPALELNTALLQRSDLPPTLQSLLQARQQTWQAQTSGHGFQFELGYGYDNNLNGAPGRSEFTLTLSGEQVVLTLDPQFRPVSGPYVNLRLGGFYQKQAPESSQDLVFSVRNRRSGHSESELLQADWRYALSLPRRLHQWELVAGTSHLLYGGSPLYSVIEARGRYRGQGSGCRSRYELATQYQLYHGQSIMTGVEVSATAGMACTLDAGRQMLGVDAGPLKNLALDGRRPGADREGWGLRLQWQLQLGQGVLNSQYSYAWLADSQGFSELLESGARRRVSSHFMRVQYSRLLQEGLVMQLNFTHQDQDSNIAPFVNRGTAAEMGLSLAF